MRQEGRHGVQRTECGHEVKLEKLIGLRYPKGCGV